MLGNGSGGIDWAGLEVVCAWLRIDDIEGLMARLNIIKHHKPETANHGVSNT